MLEATVIDETVSMPSQRPRLEMGKVGCVELLIRLR